MDIVVVGGGLGGLASAVRLAKLGHQVTLFEAGTRLGGALGRVEQDGFAWDAGPTYTLLPAVLRDLFRKSGRPLERELDLTPLPIARRHVFEEGANLDLPSGSRAAQLHAIAAVLGESAAQAWGEWTHGYAETWDLLRRHYLERDYSEAIAPGEVTALLRSRTTLHKASTKSLKRFPELQAMATFGPVCEGHHPRNVPAWVGMWAYVEQNFGTWTSLHGFASLTDALATRLHTRGVSTQLETRVIDLETTADPAQGTRVRGVRTETGAQRADAVVLAVDPRQLPSLEPLVRRTMPAIPPVVAHLGLVGDVPDLPHEVVLHGDPLLVLRTGGLAPEGAHAWTVHGRGKVAEDLLSALARHGIRVRDQVEVRVDRSPREMVESWHGSPYGVLWQGRETMRDRLGTRTPIGGLYCAGAHARTGAGIPSVGLSGALVAAAIGPA